MGNPLCPYGCGTLKLETHDYKYHPTDRKSKLRGDFYICHSCNHHWPRSAVISRNTARDGVKPQGVDRL